MWVQRNSVSTYTRILQSLSQWRTPPVRKHARFFFFFLFGHYVQGADSNLDKMFGFFHQPIETSVQNSLLSKKFSHFLIFHAVILNLNPLTAFLESNRAFLSRFSENQLFLSHFLSVSNCSLSSLPKIHRKLRTGGWRRRNVLKFDRPIDRRSTYRRSQHQNSRRVSTYDRNRQNVVFVCWSSSSVYLSTIDLLDDLFCAQTVTRQSTITDFFSKIESNKRKRAKKRLNETHHCLNVWKKVAGLAVTVVKIALRIKHTLFSTPPPPPILCTYAHHPPRMTTLVRQVVHAPCWRSLADIAVGASFTLTNFSSRFVFQSCRSDDRLWRENLSHGNSAFPRVLVVL